MGKVLETCFKHKIVHLFLKQRRRETPKFVKCKVRYVLTNALRDVEVTVLGYVI